jgi:single-stranded-DNA-specific exonuclease
LRKAWIIKGNNERIPDELLNEAGSHVIAKLLVSRGIDSVAKARDFLNPLKMSITNPCVFSQMQRALKELKDAVANGEKVII